MTINRMLPGTRALRTFEAAARHLNFTRAAEEVGLTPAAVSYQIKEIEDQLGVTLFTRTSRSIRLTPAGTVLYEATADALDTLHRAASRARRMARSTTQLRVSMSPMFASNWLFPRLPRFRAAHPDLELTFDISDEVRDFELDDIDVAIRFGNGRYEGARSERLFDTVIVPVCSPRLLERAEIKEPRDLLDHMLCYVDCKVDGVVWPDWRMWMAAAGVQDFDDSGCIPLPDSSHVVQAVVDGSGVGLAELAMVAGELARGTLVRLLDVEVRVPAEYGYWVVWPEGRERDERVRGFRRWVVGEVGGGRG